MNRIIGYYQDKGALEFNEFAPILVHLEGWFENNDYVEVAFYNQMHSAINKDIPMTYRIFKDNLKKFSDDEVMIKKLLGEM